MSLGNWCLESWWGIPAIPAIPAIGNHPKFWWVWWGKNPQRFAVQQMIRDDHAKLYCTTGTRPVRTNGPPRHRSRAARNKTADRIGSSLTLPKLHLTTLICVNAHSLVSSLVDSYSGSGIQQNVLKINDVNSQLNPKTPKKCKTLNDFENNTGLCVGCKTGCG